ncbi:MAG: winged helix-turn-helix domain-containing protein [Gammaproteobacteria bacterium]
MTGPGPNPANLASAYKFGEFTLDTERGTLLKDGAEIKLRPKSYKLLVYLLQRPGKLVSRDELMTAIWGQTVVTEDSITHCVIDIRKAIGDAEQQMIRTIPKRGYILELDVTTQAVRHDGAGEPAGNPDIGISGRGIALAATILLALLTLGGVWWQIDRSGTEATDSGNDARVAPANSIAVLPFVDLSANQDQRYFAEGISEEVIHLLAQAPDLLVIARTSSFSFGENTPDIATVAKVLNVAHILEGSVRRSEDRFRVTAQLVDATTSAHVWSRVYERDLDDILEVQRDIATAVAAQLKSTLTRIVDDDSPHNIKAYELFLQANFFFNRRGPGDAERARDYYQEATQLDPGFARAWAGLAGAYQVMIGDGLISSDKGLAKLKAASERALELDPSLPEAHIRMANYLWRAGQRDDARQHQKIAFDRGPTNSLVLAVRAGSADQIEEAIELQQRAVAIDPLSGTNRANLANYLVEAGRFDEALQTFAIARDLAPGNADKFAADITRVLILQARFDEALASTRARPDDADRQQALVMIHQALDQPSMADAELKKLAAGQDAGTFVRLAEIQAFQGDSEQAYALLEQAREQIREMSARGDSVWDSLVRIDDSRFLIPLHDDPRWQPLIDSLPW